MSAASVVVVGAGISGLTAAWRLRRDGAEVTVLEKEQAPGGTMRTVREEGWLMETGPNSALATTPLFGEMFDQLGIAGDRRNADPASARRYILRGGFLHPLPMSPPAFFASRLWTTGGKLRLLKEPFVGRAAREESIAQFVERRLGREFLDYAINPFVAGVYAGDPAALSVRAAFPKLYALEEKYGGLIRGMIGGARERKRRKEVAKDRAAMFSFRGGMETFPRAIARELGKDLHTKAEVESVVPRGSEWVIRWRSGGVSHERSARAVVLSIPAHAAARAVAPLLPALAGTLEGIVYPPVTEVFLGFRRGAFAQPLDGFGFLVPAVERRRILGTIWSSALFPERAPEGHDALTTFVGGARQPGLALLGDEEIIAAVTKELNSVLRGSAAPVFARVFRWEKAIPQYLLGYGKVVGEIEAAERSHPGLHFCSNYRGGIAVGDCVMSAHRTAERVKRQLGL